MKTKHVSDAFMVLFCIIGSVIVISLAGCGTIASEWHGDCGRIYEEDYKPASKYEGGRDLLMCAFDIKSPNYVKLKPEEETAMITGN